MHVAVVETQTLGGLFVCVQHHHISTLFSAYEARPLAMGSSHMPYRTRMCMQKFIHTQTHPYTHTGLTHWTMFLCFSSRSIEISRTTDFSNPESCNWVGPAGMLRPRMPGKPRNLGRVEAQAQRCGNGRNGGGSVDSSKQFSL